MGDPTALATTVTANRRSIDAADILGNLRRMYREQNGEHCDVVLLAVPKGRGHNVARALQQALEALDK